MTSKLRAHFLSTVAPAVIAGASLVTTCPAFAACQGPGAPTNTITKCLTAIPIPGNPLQSFDISWANPARAEYYLGDRANAGIDIINTQTLQFLRTIGGFVGIKLVAAGNAIDNNHSGPDGVTSHGKWLYAGDGDSTLKVIDLTNFQNPIQQSISTGGTTRVDEMALTPDGRLLLAANNAEDPPFATLFSANGDNAASNVSILNKITVNPGIIPAGFGLSLEQPTWESTTARFYTSIPIIANNPTGCNYGQLSGPITCHGGLLVVDPANLPVPAVFGPFNATINAGVLPLSGCSPNGITVGPSANLLEGCTPGNNPSDTTTLVINANTKNFATVANITGSDEVWFNSGDNRYFLGASKAIKPAGSTLGSGAVLGVVDGTSVLIETIPQSSNSHSVAADSTRNLIFVPQVNTTGGLTSGGVTIGGDTNTTAGAGSPTVGQQICGQASGCIAVYQ
jgi:hypothetical protein